MSLAVPRIVEQMQSDVACATAAWVPEGAALAARFQHETSAARHTDVQVFSDMRRKASSWR